MRHWSKPSASSSNGPCPSSSGKRWLPQDVRSMRGLVLGWAVSASTAQQKPSEVSWPAKKKNAAGDSGGAAELCPTLEHADIQKKTESSVQRLLKSGGSPAARRRFEP